MIANEHPTSRSAITRAAVDPQLFRERLIQRGATVIGGGRHGPHEWVTLTDPEGNEFCADHGLSDPLAAR